MIIPTKHTNISESLLGFGAYLLSQLKKSATVDELWTTYQLDYENNIYIAKHSFDKLILTIVFLYSIGAVSDNDGVIKLCDY